jgi:hypothetical protein
MDVVMFNEIYVVIPVKESDAPVIGILPDRIAIANPQFHVYNFNEFSVEKRLFPFGCHLLTQNWSHR